MSGIHQFVPIKGVASALPVTGVYNSFFAWDNGGSSSVPINSANLINTTPMYNAFVGQFSSQAEENFEAIPVAFYTATGLTLTFGAITALLKPLGAATIEVASVTPGTTNGFGRYSVPSSTSSRFLGVSNPSPGTDPFEITFSQDVRAFGFWGIDIGDFNGTLTVSLLTAADVVLKTQLIDAEVRFGTGQQVQADGSVLFLGMVGNAAGDLFRKVRFVSTQAGGAGDSYAFDRMMVGIV